MCLYGNNEHMLLCNSIIFVVDCSMNTLEEMKLTICTTFRDFLKSHLRITGYI